MKATLITGASSGIGEAFARRLAAEKHNLVLVARSEEKLHQLCDELMIKYQITAHYVALDLTEFEADKRLFEETEKHELKVDWLINNAGFGSMGDFANLELRTPEQTIRLTLMEAQLLRYLVKHEGNVVSRKAILEKVWGLNEDTDTRAIDNFIVRLRKYIEDDPTKPEHLLTVRGVGYVIKEPT